MRLIALFFLIASRISFAASILEWGGCITENQIRTGDISFDKLPCIIIGIASTLLSFVGYISLGIILLWGLYYIFWGVSESAKETGKTAVKMAFIGALISWSSWVIVNFILDNM